MLDEMELNELEILDWSALAKRFEKADLFLGNGFSINISPRLRYDSLFDKFLTECGDTDRQRFNSFNTTNFEVILEKLSNAREVNKIFEIETSNIELSIECLKDGLVKTIEAVHPRWAETDQAQLERIAFELTTFNDIYTLNYDLYLYRIILILNDKHRTDASIKPYSDYFWEIHDEHFLSPCIDPSQKFEGYRHPYYLHGALFLFRKASYDLKLRKGDSPSELMEAIGNIIREGEIPLFVSEGTPEGKKEAIRRSEYLKFALRKLEDSKNSLVIFGSSLSDPDKHIVDAINRNTRDLAISVHIGSKAEGELIIEKHRMESMFPDHKVDFFNSDTLFEF
jgi:hypothetical protein